MGGLPAPPETGLSRVSLLLPGVGERAPSSSRLCCLFALQARRQGSAPQPEHRCGRCAGSLGLCTTQSSRLCVLLFSKSHVEGARGLESGVVGSSPGLSRAVSLSVKWRKYLLHTDQMRKGTCKVSWREAFLPSSLLPLYLGLGCCNCQFSCTPEPP